MQAYSRCHDVPSCTYKPLGRPCYHHHRVVHRPRPIAAGLQGVQPQRPRPRRGSRAQQRCTALLDAHVGSLKADDMKFGIVVARFNDVVTRNLLHGAIEAFIRHGARREDIEVAWVPGSFEVPIVAKSMAKSGAFDAVLTLGAVVGRALLLVATRLRYTCASCLPAALGIMSWRVRGSTTHYEAVANAASSGTLAAGQESGVPVIFGVLTTETMEQAVDRAGGKLGNKGGETAVCAIETANVLKQLRSAGKAAAPWGLGS